MDEDGSSPAWRRRALGARGEEMIASRAGAAAALHQLRETHRRLWDLEDRARSRSAHDYEIAQIKRDIDATNALRHRQIDALDDLVIAGRTGPVEGRLYSQTPGEICDRLLILELKANQLRMLANDAALPDDDRARCKTRLAQQQQWHRHLQDCLVEQVADHDAQRARLPPRAEIKLYNDRLLNAVTRREGVR